MADDPETHGKLTLKLMIMPDFHRRAAMVRQTGMKIKDKGNISGLIPFAGVLFIEGDAINTYLRKMENPQHLEWEIERADNKSKAKRLMSFMTRFIKESLEEMKNDDSEEALDPSVGEYLSALKEEDVTNQERTEDIKDDIRDVKIKVTDVKPRPEDSQPGKEESSEIEDDEGDLSVTDLPGEGGSGNQNSGGSGGNGGGHNPGSGGGDMPVEHRKSLSAISPTNVRNLVRDKDSGKYTIVFVPSVSATDGILEIYMSAESQNYNALIVSAECTDCPDLTFKKNKIENLVFTAQKALRIDIQIDYSDFCPMEVKAYGNKI